LSVSVFSNYPFIKKAEIVFSPSWRSSLPEDETHISIEKIS